MRLNLRNTRKRRGMTNLVEAVSCLILFSFLMTMLLTIMGAMSSANIESQETLIEKMEADNFIETLQTDIKSAGEIELSNSVLHLISDEEMHTYQIQNQVLFRDGELFVSDIESGMFIPVDKDSVGVYIRFGSGEVMDITFTR